MLVLKFGLWVVFDVVRESTSIFGEGAFGSTGVEIFAGFDEEIDSPNLRKCLPR